MPEEADEKSESEEVADVESPEAPEALDLDAVPGALGKLRVMPSRLLEVRNSLIYVTAREDEGWSLKDARTRLVWAHDTLLKIARDLSGILSYHESIEGDADAKGDKV